MKPVTVIEGRRTYWMNFFDTYGFNQQKLVNFVADELGTFARIENDRLMIKGRYTPKQIQQVARKYSADPDVLLYSLFYSL